MKVLSNLLLLLLFIGSAFSLNYYASEMASVETVRVLYDEHLSDNALTEGNVYLIADNGSDLVWTQVSCQNKTGLKNLLREDYTETVTLAGEMLKRGPCCINPHHGACQVELDNIRAACGGNHTAKGGVDNNATEGHYCPA